MGLIENVGASRTEQRTIGGVPWMPWTDPRMRFDVGGPTHPSRNTIYGVDTALGLPALYAGAKILADNTAVLPMNVYQRNRSGRLLRYNGPSVFDKPSVIGTRFDWLFAAVSSMVLQGNAWGLITGRDGYGLPTGIEWLPPQYVDVAEDQDQPFNPLQTKVYAMGREMQWRGPDKELFHVKGFALPGRVEGVSPLRAFADVISSGMSAAEFGRTWFDAGGFPTGTFQNSEMEVDPEGAAKIRAMLMKSLREHTPLVFGRDWDYTPVTVPPAESQFLETMQLNATQIAAILSLPPERLGGEKGSYTYSNQEQATLQIIEAITPWFTRLEQAFSDDCLPRNRVTRFNTDALLRTSLETRMAIYQIQRNIGMRTIDEIRELEDLDPMPGDVGNEALPLVLMTSMAQRAGAIPSSLLPQTTLLMDLAAKKLQQLKKQGLTMPSPIVPANPQTGAPAQGPAPDPATGYAGALAAASRQLDEKGDHSQAVECRFIEAALNDANRAERLANGTAPNGIVEGFLDETIRESRKHEDGGGEWDVTR